MRNIFLSIIMILLSFTGKVIYAQEYLAVANYKGKEGFIDKSGRWHINPLFDEVTGFENGLATARIGTKWGYINTTGEYVIPARYDKAEPFEHFIFARVESDHRSFYIGRKGDILCDSDTGVAIFTDGMAIVKSGGRFGYIGRDNQWKIKPQFEMAWPFNNGYARVKKDGEWIFINKQGEKYNFSQLSRSIISGGEKNNFNKKVDKGKWGFANNQDKWVIPPKFDYVDSFSEGLAPVMVENKWGYIDTTGNIKIPFIFEEAFIFNNGLASVRIKDKYGSIDKTGALVIKARFDKPIHFFIVNDLNERSYVSDDAEIISMKNIRIPEFPDSINRVYSPGDKRLALIIGNSNYTKGNYLANPENDAREMTRALERLGFVVKTYLNVSQAAMKKAIDDFGKMLKDYNVGLFFYAGHGVQVKGYNYLIPVDASIQSENDVEYECVEAGRVLNEMEKSECKTNIVILDACRNNPFERSWSRSASGQGLAFMNAPSGSIIAYATAPGYTASDGSGKNGLYTSSLLKHIMVPGITILEVFQHVRSEVRKESGNQQIPWESTSMEGNFYFIK
jgi:hypothetical protein